MPFKQTVVSACPMNKTLFNKLQKCFKMKKSIFTLKEFIIQQLKYKLECDTVIKMMIDFMLGSNKQYGLKNKLESDNGEC